MKRTPLDRKWWQRLVRRRWTYVIHHADRRPELAEIGKVCIISGHAPTGARPAPRWQGPFPYIHVRFRRRGWTGPVPMRKIYPQMVGYVTEETVPHSSPTYRRRGYIEGVAYDVVLDDGTTFRQSFDEVTPVGPQAAKAAIRSRLYELQPRPGSSS